MHGIPMASTILHRNLIETLDVARWTITAYSSKHNYMHFCDLYNNMIIDQAMHCIRGSPHVCESVVHRFLICFCRAYAGGPRVMSFR